jgi:hypothetical protein
MCFWDERKWGENDTGQTQGRGSGLKGEETRDKRKKSDGGICTREDRFVE